jgi:protein SCO1
MMITAWALAVVAVVSFVASGMWRRGDQPKPAGPEPLPKLYQVGDFQLVNQDGKPFTDKDLAGKVWIADFVFTQCMGPCPEMTAAMLQIQKDLAGAPVQLVSVSVDPANDTPPVLKQYMKNMSADEKTWTFATGDEKKIFTLARNMKIAAAPADEQNTILHAEKFILVDAQGWIRGYYHYQDPQKRADLLRDARLLASGLP